MGAAAPLEATSPGEERRARPPLLFLVAAAVLGLSGLVVGSLPAATALMLIGAWLVGGVLSLLLVVAFTHVDVRRQAAGWHFGSPVVPWLRSGALVLAVAAVVVAAVHLAILVSHTGLVL